MQNISLPVIHHCIWQRKMIGRMLFKHFAGVLFCITLFVSCISTASHFSFDIGVDDDVCCFCMVYTLRGGSTCDIFSRSSNGTALHTAIDVNSSVPTVLALIASPKEVSCLIFLFFLLFNDAICILTLSNNIISISLCIAPPSCVIIRDVVAM